MRVGDGAVVPGGAALGGVAVDFRLGHGIGDLFVVHEARQTGVGDGVGVVAVVDHGGRGTIDRGRQRQQLGELGVRRTNAVLVAGINPLLGNLEVGEPVVVGEGHLIGGVGALDGAGGRLAGLPTAVGCFAGLGGLRAVLARELRLVEVEAIRQVALGEGVGGAGGQVRETQVPIGLHLDGNLVAAGSIVVALVIRSYNARTGDVGVRNRGAGVRVVNREPHVVVGVRVRGRSAGSFGVIDRQREREGLVGVGILAGDDLGQVEVGATVVVCLERHSALSGNVVGLAVDHVLIIQSFNMYDGKVNAWEFTLLFQDERVQFAVDEHGMNDWGNELPVVLLRTKLCKGKVMTVIKNLRLAIFLVDAHKASGDVDRVLGPCGIVIGRQGDIGEFLLVREHGQADCLCLAVVELVLPIFVHRHLFCHKTDRFGIGVDCRLLTIISTGIGVGKLGLGIGFQSTVFVKVLLLVRVEVVVILVAVLNFRNRVIGVLTRPHVEGHGIGDTVEQRTNAGKIPVDRGTVERCGRRSLVVRELGSALPLELELTARDAASNCNGTSATSHGASVAIYLHGIGGLLARRRVDPCELVVRNGNGQPVFERPVVNLKEMSYVTSGRFHCACRPVRDGHCANAKRFDDLLEDAFDCLGQCGRVRCREVVVGRLGAPTDSTLGTRVGVVHQVVKQVGLGTIRVDTIQGSVLAGLNCPSTRETRLIERTQLVQTAIGADSIVAITARRRCTIRNKDDKGRIVISPAKQRLSVAQGTLPVCAIRGVSGVCQLSLTVGATVVKEAIDAVRVSKVAGPVLATRLLNRSSSCERHQGHLNVGWIR